MDCPSCGFASPEGLRFCGRCGADFERAPAPEAERRQLTVMFCDVVDSTRIAARLGAEAWRERLDAFHATGAGVIARHEGRVAQYLGDGLLVYFGHPVAHDDDAARALRAALELQEAWTRAADASDPDALRARIGVHTGTVVVGEIGRGPRREDLALGDTLHLAARLHGEAEAGEIAVSEATRRLVEGLIATEPLGERILKGFPEPVAMHRVIGTTGAASRFDVAVAAGLHPLVGRDEELATLLAGAAHAAEGCGRLVALAGEPGIGKSRLVHTLRETLRGRPCRWLAAACSPYEQSRALAPIAHLLERALDAAAARGGAEGPAAALERLLAEAGLEPRAGAVLAPLVGLPIPPEIASDLSPQRQRYLTLSTLAGWLARAAPAGPTVLVVEDLHWADPSTLELLGLLVQRLAGEPLLLVPTWRVGFEPPWPVPGDGEILLLGRLEPEDTAHLVEAVARGRGLPEPVVRDIVAKSEGVPLFVEEITKGVLDAAPLGGSDGATAIPSSLQDSLAARLDRSGEGKELAQLASVIGREFQGSILRALASRPDDAVDRGLGRLLAMGLLLRKPEGDAYRFKHALIRDAAYASLLGSTRRRLHERAGRALAGIAPPEVVARHFSEARCHADAARHWGEAAKLSMAQTATREARIQLDRALAHLEEVPASAERDALEIALRIPRVGVIQEQGGFASPELAQAFERLDELTGRGGDPVVRLEVMLRRATFHNTRAEYSRALAVMDRMLALAEELPGFRPPPHFYNVRAIVLANSGRPGEALACSEQAVASCDDAPEQVRMPSYPDHRVTAESQTGLILWLAGRPGPALERGRRALELALAIDPPHLYSVGWARNYLALVLLHRREFKEARELAERNLHLGQERGFATWWLMGTLMSAMARIELGEADAGVPALEQALGLYELSGARMIVPFLKGALAEGFLRLGDLDRADALLASARSQADDCGEGYARPDLDRIEGELLRARAPADRAGAEAAYRRAIARAEAAGQGSWALRAAFPLARLLAAQGRRDEARRCLASHAIAVAESLDAPDAVEAEALLAELGSDA